MPKVRFTCRICGNDFHLWPAAVRYAERRGAPIQFCSRKCMGQARSTGLIGAKKRTGQNLICEVCQSSFYRERNMIEAGKSRFCSEPCRLRAHELRLIDRTAPRPQNLRGAEIECMFCGTKVYRKKSMLSRNIGKTCGDPKCVSAYGRQLWGLAPRLPEIVILPRPQRRYRGKANFTAEQRQNWLNDHCLWCGTTNNLTLDHIIPVCAGGLAVRSNAQTLCGPCNNWKAKYIDRPLARQQSQSGG